MQTNLNLDFQNGKFENLDLLERGRIIIVLACFPFVWFCLYMVITTAMFFETNCPSRPTDMLNEFEWNFGVFIVALYYEPNPPRVVPITGTASKPRPGQTISRQERREYHRLDMPNQRHERLLE